MTSLISHLLDLSLRGSLVLMAVLICDALFAKTMTAGWRKLWWLLVPVAFLLPVSFSPSSFTHQATPVQTAFDHDVLDYVALLTASAWIPESQPVPPIAFSTSAVSWVLLIWLAGMVIGLARMIIPTWKVQGQWSGKRFSTDPDLLNLLEDAKATAGVTAPIGLVVSDQIIAPALLGWLRPRILLPADWTATSSPAELKAVLLHELAHFKSLDIPLNWLFSAMRTVHWFNPLAWMAASAWRQFREEAADERAIAWMQEKTGAAYGEILLKTLGKCPSGPAPYGAMAIGESVKTLKRRIIMIRNYQSKSSRSWMATAVIFTLGLLMVVSPTMAGDETEESAKKDAVAAMQTWLTGIDGVTTPKAGQTRRKAFRKR